MDCDGAAVLARAESDEGVSRLKAGEHAVVFARHCGAWLAAEPDLPVVLVGMAGSREGWTLAPYAECPAGVDEIAAALTSIEIGNNRRGVIVPGVRLLQDGRADVMRGEETHLLGSGVTDGLVCLPGTHCKWALLRGGRIASFATFLTGELYALLREHSMVGRPATEPPDPAGFAEGLAASPLGGREAGGGLLNRLFAARAATLTGRLGRERLGPYLSGLLTGEEIAGAFGRALATASGADELVPLRQRHIGYLRGCLDHLARARVGKLEIELRAEELRLAADQLGMLTGDVGVEELLGAIFSRFCIGK